MTCVRPGAMNLPYEIKSLKNTVHTARPVPFRIFAEVGNLVWHRPYQISYGKRLYSVDMALPT